VKTQNAVFVRVYLYFYYVMYINIHMPIFFFKLSWYVNKNLQIKIFNA